MPLTPTQADIFYSLPEIWDFCLEKIYDKPAYVNGLVTVFQQLGITQQSLILDAGCGSGFPSIDLIQRGYHIMGTDKSSEMVRQVTLNAQRRGVSIEAHHVMWSDLSRRFNDMFDLVYCRGNSLVYAASWEQNWIVPERSREEILSAIQNFYAVLKPGGFVYIDKTSKNEQPHEKHLGTVTTTQGPVDLWWRMDHDPINHIRTWTMQLHFETSKLTRTYSSYSYLLSPEEIVTFMQNVGFREIQECVPVEGEPNYDVYIAKK